MTNDNDAQFDPVPTEWVTWGQSIDRQPGALYRFYIGGPNLEEWRPEPDEKD